jgi:hypothetical protein
VSRARAVPAWLALVALVALVALTALTFAPRRALAQAKDVSLTATVDPPIVEIGTTFRYALEAQVIAGTGAAPRGAAPGQLPASLTVVGTSTSSSMRIGPGGQTVGTSSVWTIRTSKLGTFTLGPASVDVGGSRRSAAAVKVTVVPVGKAPKRAAPDPFDPFGSGNPFDLFNQGGQAGQGGPSSLRDLLDDRRLRVPMDPRYALDQPRAPKAFLRAVPDKTRAVVGEQVKLDVYLYSLPDVELGRAQDVHVPSAPDFTRRPLVDAGPAKNLGRTTVGDRAWDVELVLRDALFPVKPGRLVVGPMTLVLTGSRVGYRESESVAVEVTEPPLVGRPAGYAVGDVGDYALSASVSPRKVTRGEAVGVQVELRGTGNLPTQLVLPEGAGIEWMDAQTKETIGPEREERIGGTRTFTYVVRIDRDGAVDLGDVKLPYWDPDKKAYKVARAALGILDVARGAAHAARDAGAPSDEDRVLVDLPKPRTALEGTAEIRYLSERRGWWAAVFGAPLACACAIVVSGALGRARARRRDRAPDPARLAKTRAAEAEAALAGTDGSAALGAVAKALEANVLAQTGVNVRGTTGSALVAELVAKGVAVENAEEVASLLRACEDARFSPAGVSMQDARDIGARMARVQARLVEARP